MKADIAMGITIALRFISVLSEEMDRIIKAQTMRGAAFDTGNFFQRAKSMLHVIRPLFQNAINRAESLGDAMDARCYQGGRGRTKLKPLSYDTRDFLMYLFMVALLCAGIWMAITF